MCKQHLHRLQMLLKTFLKKLVVQPKEVRHDAYDGKYMLEFEKIDGYFPYIEFQSVPKDGNQEVYVDVLNWDLQPQKYVSSINCNNASFMKVMHMSNGNQLSVIDVVNARLQAFYMMFNEVGNHKR